MNKRKIGKMGEDMATAFLENKGVVILGRNYRNRFGEIDIIAKEKDVILFIEVKYRKDCKFGYPLEAVGIAKQEKIKRIASYYLKENCSGKYMNIRFDCIGIMESEIEWVKGAFY